MSVGITTRAQKYFKFICELKIFSSDPEKSTLTSCDSVTLLCFFPYRFPVAFQNSADVFVKKTEMQKAIKP